MHQNHLQDSDFHRFIFFVKVASTLTKKIALWKSIGWWLKKTKKFKLRQKTFYTFFEVFYLKKKGPINFNIFINCKIYYRQSITLGQSAYNCNWFYLPPGKMRSFMLIIQRCRKPVQFTAAKFYVMNMEKFGNVMIE